MARWQFLFEIVRRSGGSLVRQVAMALSEQAADRRAAARVVPPGTILMSGTRPDLRIVPVDLITRAYRRVMRSRGPSLLSYRDPAGVTELREALASMLSATRGLAIDSNSVFVTRGSQMALALTARALLRAGDAVAVEDPGYRSAWEAFRAAGARIVPVPVDEHGMRVDLLEPVITRQRIRAVYVTPHHHSMPRPSSASLERRLQARASASRRSTTTNLAPP